MRKKTNVNRWLVMAVILVCSSYTAAYGRTIYVDDDQPADFNSIQAAIEDSDDGDRVVVLPGRYYENIDFQGRAITLTGSDPNDANVVEATVIDANKDAPDDIVVSFHSGESPNSVISGFTITGGQAQYGAGICCWTGCSPTITDCNITGNSATKNGGGIYCYSSSNPTIINCTITGNSAANEGGGIYCWDSDPTVSNCTLSGNSATNEGGGIYCYSSSNPTIINCTITGNSANVGGGICCIDDSDPTVSNCTFTGNSAYAGGGICCIEDSDPTVSKCTFSGNSADAPGGGMFNLNSDPTISNCTFTGNSAGEWGGGICCYYYSDATVSNCTFSGNSASEGGGICCCWYSDPTVSNCTITGNSANEGGGIYCYEYSKPTAINCILTGNSAYWGGGICCYDYSDATVNNCTLAGNFADFGGGICSMDYSIPVITNNIIVGSPFGCGIYAMYSTPLISYNNVWGNTDEDYCGWAFAGEGDMSSDPCFGDPGYWEDPCNTPGDHTDDVWIDGDYHLLASSPCIDAGDNNSVPADSPDLDGDGNTVEPIPWDLDGRPRIVDGDCNGSNIVDMGAYEFTLDIDGDGIRDANDNCPVTFNPAQSDIDEDGAGDLCDICPADANDECDPNGSTAEEIDPNEGGTIETPTGDLVIEIEPNDVNEPVTISVTQVLPEDPNADMMIGPNPGEGQAVAVYDLEPNGLVFNEPVTLTITADVTELNENERERLGVYLWDDILEKFVLVESADCNVLEDPCGTFIKTCTVELEHFSIYAVVLPMEWDTLANGDLTGEGAIDIQDLRVMARDWLEIDSIADIAPAPDGDNMVNLVDFGIMALHWLEGTIPF